MRACLVLPVAVLTGTVFLLLVVAACTVQCGVCSHSLAPMSAPAANPDPAGRLYVATWNARKVHGHLV